MDQGVVDDERAGIEGVPLVPVGEVVPAAELVFHLVGDEVDGIVVADLSAPGVPLHEPRTHVEHGPSLRVQGSGAEEGDAHGDGLPCLAAGEQVEEVDVAVGGGIDDLDEVLRVLIYVADAQGGQHLRLPLDQEGLSGPGGARVLAQLPHDGLPGDLHGLQGDGGRAEGEAVPVGAAAEGDDAGHVRIGVLVDEGKPHLPGRGIPDLVLVVHPDGGFEAILVAAGDGILRVHAQPLLTGHRGGLARIVALAACLRGGAGAYGQIQLALLLAFLIIVYGGGGKQHDAHHQRYGQRQEQKEPRLKRAAGLAAVHTLPPILL